MTLSFTWYVSWRKLPILGENYGSANYLAQIPSREAAIDFASVKIKEGFSIVTAGTLEGVQPKEELTTDDIYKEIEKQTRKAD